jgi:hypothetical protein
LREIRRDVGARYHLHGGNTVNSGQCRHEKRYLSIIAGAAAVRLLTRSTTGSDQLPVTA